MKIMSMKIDQHTMYDDMILYFKSNILINPLTVNVPIWGIAFFHMLEQVHLAPVIMFTPVRLPLCVLSGKLNFTEFTPISELCKTY